MRKIKNKLIGLCVALTSFLPFQAFAQSSGIQWRNGDVLTANALQSLDDAKMNLSSLGLPGFAAKLDALGRVTSPVVGDISKAIATPDGQTVTEVATKANNAVQTNGGDASKTVVTATSHNAPAIDPTLSQLIADNAYIHSLGASIVGADGTISPEKLGSILGSAVRPLSLRISSGESIPAGQSAKIAMPDTMVNRVMLHADGQLYNSRDESSTNTAWNGGNTSKAIGEGALVEAFEPKYGIMRNREYNNDSTYDYLTYRMPAPITSDFYTKNSQWTLPKQCQSPSDPAYNGFWCDIGSWKSNVHYDNISTSSNAGTNGNLMEFYSTGMGHWKSDDVGTWRKMYMRGTNWGWAGIREMIEEASISIGGYTDTSGTQQYPGFQRDVNEWDMAGIGNDIPSAYYNPVLSLRKGLWFNTYDIGSLTWKPSQSFLQYQIILVTNSSGTVYMYENTAANAVTGTTQPAWAFNETTPITDGTASWVFLGTKRFEIGCVLCVGTGTGDQVGALLASNANVYDSPIDLSMVNYLTPIQAVMRTKTNSYFDLSADATKAGQNNHLLGYGHMGGIGWDTLEYVVNGKSTFHVEDTGNIGVTHTTVSAAGTTLADATSAAGQIIQISKASADNAGIRLTFAGDGDTALIQNYSGHPVKVYPINRYWSFSGGLPYYTIQNNSVIYVGSHIGGMVNYTVFFDSSQVQLPSMTKAAILAITSPNEGQKVFDSDDHTEVTYRCPTTSTCGWFPVQYGTALSN